MGEVDSALEGLDLVGRARVPSVPGIKLTIPTQVRYLQYFNTVLEGKRIGGGSGGGGKLLTLQRVIINTVPDFDSMERKAERVAAAAAAAAGDEGRQEGEQEGAAPATRSGGCRPFLECFKDGKLIFSTRRLLPASPGGSGSIVGDGTEMAKGKAKVKKWALPPHYSSEDGCFSFSFGEAAAALVEQGNEGHGDGDGDGDGDDKKACLMQGDLLFRCRHVRERGLVLLLCFALLCFSQLN